MWDHQGMDIRHHPNLSPGAFAFMMKQERIIKGRMAHVAKAPSADTMKEEQATHTKESKQ